MVAHDLRAPNNNVIALVNLLKDPTVSLADKDEFYDMIIAAAITSNDIIEDLLNLARMEFKDSKLEYTDLAVYLEAFIVNQKKLNNYSQQIKFKSQPGKYYVRLSPHKMQRVIENILSNAAKFSLPGTLIAVELIRQSDNIVILITDNGIGIPADMIPHLFSRFTKAGRKGLKGEDSNGLGLNICKLLVEQQLGRIEIHSTEGKGTQVKISLPAV